MVLLVSQDEFVERVIYLRLKKQNLLHAWSSISFLQRLSNQRSAVLAVFSLCLVRQVMSLFISNVASLTDQPRSPLSQVLSRKVAYLRIKLAVMMEGLRGISMGSVRDT